MKKFLFVSDYFDTVPSGAYNLCHAHYEALSNLFAGRQVISTLSRDKKEKPEPDKISLRCSRNRFDVLKNHLHGKYGAYSKQAEKRIIDIVMRDSYGLVWFDNYIYGSTVRKIKQLCPELPVYVFHHVVLENNLAAVVKKNLFKLKGPFRILNRMNYLRSQKISAQYADVNVVLNDRDSKTFSQLYGFDAQLRLPSCFIDTAHVNPSEKKNNDFNIFFVGGGGHPPNVLGIKWFAENVMPHLDDKAKLFIVGEKMDLWKDSPEFKNNPGISITGRVDSLDPYYNMADLVIAPIFMWPGMMTKVAEAMMYGKNILATSHALNGYPYIEEQSRCDTPEEFITRINAMIENGTERFNPAMRKIFEEKYSLDAMTKILREDFVRRGII